MIIPYTVNPNSLIVVYMDSLGNLRLDPLRRTSCMEFVGFHADDFLLLVSREYGTVRIYVYLYILGVASKDNSLLEYRLQTNMLIRRSQRQNSMLFCVSPKTK